MLITEAIMHGHAAAHRPARRRAPRHQHHHGIQGPSTLRKSSAAHRAFIARRRALRPGEEYRTPDRRRVGRVPRATSSARKTRTRRLRPGLRKPVASTSTAASAARCCASTPPSGNRLQEITRQPDRPASPKRSARAGPARQPGSRSALAATDAKITRSHRARRPPQHGSQPRHARLPETSQDESCRKSDQQKTANRP